MKCGGYGHIQVECANTWSDNEFEASNEGENICHESMYQSIFLQHNCHAQIPSPTQLADPNRFRGTKPYIWDSLFFIIFFIFFSELKLYLWVYK